MSTVDIFRPAAVDDSVWKNSVGDDKPRVHQVELPTLMGAVDGPCSLTPRLACAVDDCNRLSLLPMEDPQVMASSAEELSDTGVRVNQIIVLMNWN